MDATTTPLTNLLQTLRAKYPSLHFARGEQFFWSPEKETIYYTEDPDAEALLLHELSHALLSHTEYERDVQLVAMEREAWTEALALAATYAIPLSEDVIEDHLDTYREWLHARSTCPACTSTGFQSGHHTYTCPACTQEWKVNEARICQLRRTKL